MTIENSVQVFHGAPLSYVRAGLTMTEQGFIYRLPGRPLLKSSLGTIQICASLRDALLAGNAACQAANGDQPMVILESMVSRELAAHQRLPEGHGLPVNVLWLQRPQNNGGASLWRGVFMDTLYYQGELQRFDEYFVLQDLQVFCASVQEST